MYLSLRLFSLVCARSAMGIALLGLLGYIPGLHRLAAISDSYVPMAPATALSFLLAGGALSLLNQHKPHHARLRLTLALLTSLGVYNLLGLIGHYTGLDLNLEGALFPSTGRLQGIPLARMSHATSLSFVLVSVSLFPRLWAAYRGRENRAGLCTTTATGLTTLVLALVVTISYLDGTPLLYDGRGTIPMALTTAMGFLALATGVLTASPLLFPIRQLTARTTRAYLLRYLLPLSTLSVVLGGLIHTRTASDTAINPALYSGAIALMAALVAGVVATSLARHMGSELDRAKEAEQRATKRMTISEGKYKAIVENSPVGIYETDAQGRCTFVNKKWCEFAGLTPTQAQGDGWTDALHPDDREHIEEMWELHMGSTLPWSMEFRFCTGEGNTTWVWSTATCLMDDNGELQGYIGVSTDISEIKTAEATLLLQEETFRTTLNSLADGVISVDGEWVVVGCNPVAARLVGKRPEELIGHRIETLFSLHGANGHDAWDPVKSHMPTTHTGNIRLVTTRGDEYLVSISSAPIVDEDNATVGSVLVLRNITDEHYLQVELEKMQRLKSIGLLAGGIAHDFNNILLSLYGNLALVRDELSQHDPAYEHLVKAEESMARATNLTKQLLTFSKGGDPILKETDLQALVEEVARFDLSGSKVKPSFKVPGKLWKAHVDKGQLQQVISNLTINANQAMPEGGEIHYTMENAPLCGELFPHAEGQDFVKLTVSDTGAGIAPEHLSCIFDPYFTTKDTGIGLGLATTYSIIKKHGGHITCASTRGKGTTFTIYLPASRKHTPDHSQEPAVVAPVPKGTRVLIMDDEAAILRMVRKTLEKEHLVAHGALHGEQALELYREAIASGHPYDLVILDLTVPGGIGGQEVIREILKINPGAKAIVSSGYSQDPVMAKYREHGFAGVAEKPYTKEKLMSTLSAVYHASPATSGSD